MEISQVEESSLRRLFCSWKKPRKILGRSQYHTFSKLEVLIHDFGSSGLLFMEMSDIELNKARFITEYKTRLVSCTTGQTRLTMWCRSSPLDNFLRIKITVEEQGVLLPLFTTHDIFRALWHCREAVEVRIKSGGISKLARVRKGNPQGLGPGYFFHPKLGELRPDTEIYWLDEAVWDTLRYINCTRQFVTPPYTYSSDISQVRLGWIEQAALGSLLNYLYPVQ